MKENNRKKNKDTPLQRAWKNKTVAQQYNAKQVFDRLGLDLRIFYKDMEKAGGEGFSEFPDFKIKAYKLVFGEDFINLYNIDEKRRMDEYTQRKERKEQLKKLKKQQKLHAEMLTAQQEFENELDNEKNRLRKHSTAV